MQENYISFVRKYGMKYVSILLFWVLFLLFVLKIYSNEYSHIESSMKIGRANSNKDFLMGRKILENFSGKPDFPELQLDAAAHELTNEELIEAIETELPSLPFRYWYLNKNKKLEKSPNCSKFPNLLHLKYYNKYWQTFQLENTTFQLYNAFYDNRTTFSLAPAVHLLVMINTSHEEFPGFYCNLWYEEQLQPVLTKVLLRMIWYTNWGHGAGLLFPHLITCLIPADAKQRIPKMVSLVTKECENATNSLRVHFEKPQAPNVKQQFAVCVKGLDYPNQDISARLVEWIELQLVLGASKIFFYQLEVHANVAKVLEYYAKRGVVDIKPITLPNGTPNTPQLQHYLVSSRAEIMSKRLNELIPYNDCFYRNINNYEYIALEDIDEVLMPLGNRTTWAELVELAAKNRTEKCQNGYASYCFRNVYFPNISNETDAHFYPSSVPSYMFMLKHVYRRSQHLLKGYATKCLHRTDHVMALHNHFPIDWFKVCPDLTFETEVAQLHHYRDGDGEVNLTKIVKDMNIWRFKDVLLERSLKAFQEMHFIKDYN